MKTGSNGNLLLIIAVTVMWLVTIPFVLFFWMNVVGWPIDLTLLICLPILAVCIPVSYPLAIAGNERYRNGNGLDLSPNILARFGLLGILSGVLSVCAIELYMLFHAAMYWGVVIVGSLACVSVFVIAHVVRQLLRVVVRDR